MSDADYTSTAVQLLQPFESETNPQGGISALSMTVIEVVDQASN